jgi:transcriptional accessory protein Tex/SPT6
MQKQVNQSRLADGLEEVNIRIVNKIGVDLNLVLDHEHLQCVLQFVSGLGPRMAKRLLKKTQEKGKKLTTRGELLRVELLPFKVYFSCNPFLLIRIPDEDFVKGQVQKFDILD